MPSPALPPGQARTGAPPLFALRGVSQTRGGGTVLHDLTIELPREAITAIVGPSGAGKTSLLRLLNRLDDCATGEIRFDGRPIADYPVGPLRRRVGFVFQQPTMFPGTVADNLRTAAALGTDASRVPDPFAVLDAVELDRAYAGREADRLSGGEQQRVGLARALMTAPEVLLLDEPTAALDPEVAERLIATVVRLAATRHVSVVMVTHRLAEARLASTYLVMLEGGRLVEAGPAARLFEHAVHERTRAFLARGG